MAVNTQADDRLSRAFDALEVKEQVHISTMVAVLVNTLKINASEALEILEKIGILLVEQEDGKNEDN